MYFNVYLSHFTCVMDKSSSKEFVCQTHSIWCALKKERKYQTRDRKKSVWSKMIVFYKLTKNEKKTQLTTVRPMYFDVGGNKVDCELARISLITIRPIHTHTHTHHLASSPISIMLVFLSCASS